MFPYAKFQQVTKTHADGTTYPGLKITIAGEEMEDEDSE
jgi:hypothetical protein